MKKYDEVLKDGTKVKILIMGTQKATGNVEQLFLSTEDIKAFKEVNPDMNNREAIRDHITTEMVRNKETGFIITDSQNRAVIIYPAEYSVLVVSVTIKV